MKYPKCDKCGELHSERIEYGLLLCKTCRNKLNQLIQEWLQKDKE